MVPLHDPRITFDRFLLGVWAEKTDPQKHLYVHASPLTKVIESGTDIPVRSSIRWEDCAIAAWLMVVWKGMYGAGDVPGRIGNGPPGGFVDVGCGNGLL